MGTKKLRLKYRKETDTELAHTEIFYNDEYLGYFIRNKSIFAEENENWNFVQKSNKIKSFHSKTKKELINTLNINI